MLDIRLPPIIHARAAAARWPERLALVDGERRWSFAAFLTAVEALAAGFRRRGLAPGDRVALWMHNCAEMLLGSLALEAAGLVRVPLNARYTQVEVAAVLRDCEPGLLLVDSAHAGEAPDGVPNLVIGSPDWHALQRAPVYALPPPSPDDLCSLNYTSGSTGAAKGVMLTHRHWSAVYRNLLLDRDIRADDRLVHVGPLSHASGAYFLPWFLKGGASLISPPGRGVEGLLDTIEEHQATVFTCVPTLLTRLLRHGDLDRRNLQSLRQIGYGAEPISRATLEGAMECFGPILVQNYGQTEAMMTICTLPAAEHRDEEGRLRHGCIGRPYRQVEVVVRNPDGQALPDGETGELTVRGEHVMAGYFRREPETRRVLRDGWLWTGDLARRDGDGLFWLAGRARELIICGGFNIYPQEVAAVLNQFPGVEECCVVGLPDADWGEIAAAVVVGPAVSLPALAAWARPRLGLRTPRRWEARRSLPRTSAGKVDVPALRRELSGGRDTT